MSHQIKGKDINCRAGGRSLLHQTNQVFCDRDGYFIYPIMVLLEAE